MDVGVKNPGGDGMSSSESPSTTVCSSTPTVAENFADRLCFHLTRQTIIKQITATIPTVKER